MSHRKLIGPLTFILCLTMMPAVNAGTFEVENWKEIKLLKRKIRAAQFLNRATFGATEEQIDELANRMLEIGQREAAEEWIENQFALPATSHVDTALAMVEAEGLDPTTRGIGQYRFRQAAWWHIAITADDQLRQRMAWALSQIFVVNDRIAAANSETTGPSGEPRWLGNGKYYDMLAANSFGNYRQTLDDVTFHPVMGVFLSHLRNRKADPAANRFPDENYAREVQQLFSIGLYEMRINGKYKRRKGELVPTYDNETIKAFSRVFTGFNYGRSTSPTNGARNYNEPMILHDSGHDMDEKTLLKGVVLPAGQTAEQDVADGLDNLADHPNVGPFISRLLIQRFVKSNPSKGYIRRVACTFNANEYGERGDFKAVLKAILLDREAWRSIRFQRYRDPLRLVTVTRGTEHSKLKEPVIRYAHFVRAFHAQSSEYPGGFFALPNFQFSLGQAPYRSPSVFNFYSPFNQPAGDITDYEPSRKIPNGALYAPEFGVMTGVTANKTANRYRADIIDENARFTVLGSGNQYGPVYTRLDFDFSREKEVAPDADALLARLDLLLCDGTMSDQTRSLIATALVNETENVDLRARGAILAVLTSPDYTVSQ